MKRFIFFLLALLSFSCTKIIESSVPNFPVYFHVDLRFEDKELVGVYNYKTFTKIRQNGEAIGYGGLLLFCGVDGRYYAFDLSCPHEASKTVRVVPDDNGQAKCPKCGSIFDLSYGVGQPIEGVAETTLRRYNVSQYGQELLVQN